MFTQKEPTTPPPRFPNAQPANDSEFALPSSVTPKTIPLVDFSRRSGQVRMADPRFAVVRLGSLGDIVHTLPAVAALRDSFRAADIVWLTHPRWVELVSSSALASEIWPVDSRD